MAGRRAQMRTDESAVSTTSSLASNARIAREYLAQTKIIELEANEPLSNLQKYLSIRAVLSTTSSFAIAQDEAKDKDLSDALEEIGTGFCASVFDWTGRGRAIKRAHFAAGKNQELWNDYRCHVSTYEAVSSPHMPWSVSRLSVPVPHYFIKPEDVARWMGQHRREFPSLTAKEPTAVLVSERILPLPRRIRQDIVAVFCPPHRQAAASKDPKNKACLIRLYLGVRRRPNIQQSESDQFSLRNFELSLDRMQKLGLDPKEFVIPMAEALAVMHHRLLLDANDVEFVLGSSPEKRVTAKELESLTDRDTMITTWRPVMDASIKDLNFMKRAVNMWLLDFNNVRSIRHDDAGVRMCVESFWQNDPYYPRPSFEEGMERELWDLFKDAYMEKTRLMSYTLDFANAVILGIEEEGKKRAGGGGGPPVGPPKGTTNDEPSAPGMKTKGIKAKKHRQYVVA